MRTNTGRRHLTSYSSANDTDRPWDLLRRLADDSTGMREPRERGADRGTLDPDSESSAVLPMATLVGGPATRSTEAARPAAASRSDRLLIAGLNSSRPVFSSYLCD